MTNRRPELLAVWIALAGIIAMLIAFAIDLTLSHRQVMRVGENRLRHLALMMSEHSARAFEAIDGQLNTISKELSLANAEWLAWGPEGWDYLARHHSRGMLQLRSLALFDHDGNQRFLSTNFQAPRINVADRPYFDELRRGAEQSAWGPFPDRNTGYFSYALARRISARNGAFAGGIVAFLEPQDFQDFCWSNRLSEDFELSLINRNQEIVATCRPSDPSRHAPMLGKPLGESIFSPQLKGVEIANGLSQTDGLLLMRTSIPGHPDLSIVAGIPKASLLTEWRSRAWEFFGLWLLLSAFLCGGAWMMRRQVARLQEITQQLEDHRHQLEQRVVDATQELAMQRDDADRANVAKSRFLAAASHDLRQPLHALTLFASDLQHRLRQGHLEELPHLAQQISVSTATLSGLLNALLDVSRLDSNGIKPEIQTFPIDPLLQRIEETFAREAKEKGLRLRIRRAPRIWLETDPSLLERMLGNLVANALRYTPNGGSILVGVRQRLGRCIIEVRDNGIGIASSHHQHIFSEFYQVGNAAREHDKGLGLGLSIVRRLARALAIQVTLSSHLGEGSCFRLAVTMARRELPTKLADEAQVDPRNSICCIGHSDDLSENMALLKRWGFAVEPRHLEEITPTGLTGIVIADAECAMAVAAIIPSTLPLIVICRDDSWETPAHAHILPIPTRPAKLRALVTQLQKTLSRSIP